MQEALSSATARDLAVVVAVSLGAHALYLALNFLCARFVLRLPRKQLIAVVIAGSEKTIGISATLAKDLRPRVFGESSLLLAPGLIAHICQMFMDSLVVELINVFKSDVPRHERAGASERSQEVRAAMSIRVRLGELQTCWASTCSDTDSGVPMRSNAFSCGAAR